MARMPGGLPSLLKTTSVAVSSLCPRCPIGFSYSGSETGQAKTDSHGRIAFRPESKRTGGAKPPSAGLAASRHHRILSPTSLAIDQLDGLTGCKTGTEFKFLCLLPARRGGCHNIFSALQLRFSDCVMAACLRLSRACSAWQH